MPDSVVRTPRKTRAKPPIAGFLAGGGEMGRRMRALDWSLSPLGSPQGWSASLRTAVRILLTARQPMLLWWGERMALLYNDACKGIVGAHHPGVLGQPASAAWRELWERVGARVTAVARSNESAYDEAVPIAIDREAATAPTSFAISYSPVPDDEGGPGGTLAVLNETLTMHDAVIELSSELDTDSLVHKVTDAATRLTKARYGAFFYNAERGEGDSYRLFSISGVPRESVEKLGMPRVTTLFQPTFKGERVVRIDDVTKDARYGKSGPFHGMPPGHFPVKSYLAVPVVSRTGEVLGGLFFGHPEPAMFDERAERIARVIAAHAAVAIDNANLFGIARGEIEERSRVEIALRESERRYRDLIEALPAALYTTDAEGRLVVFNSAAAQLWGREPQRGIDRWGGSHRLFLPDGTPVAREDRPLARMLRGETSESAHELIVERPDGTRRNVLANPRTLRDSTGAIAGAINVVVDITELKEAQAELARTRDELQQQVKTLTRLHEMAARLATLEDIEPALQAILETAVDAEAADFGLLWIYDASRDRLTPAASVGFTAEDLAALSEVKVGEEGGASGTCFQSGTRVTVLDSQTDPRLALFRDVAANAGFRAIHSTPIATRGGRMLGALSVHFRESRLPTTREVQLAELCARYAAEAIEHHRSAAAIRESERLYRAIGESINYGIWVCDENGDATYVSDSFLRLTGLTAGKYRKSIWSTVLHPDDAQRVRTQWVQCVAEGRDWEAQVRVKTAAGDWRAILSRGVAIRDETGRITGWAGMNLDIDRLKRVENELRELDQRKNEFLATLAHELRNPLAPIRNGREIMRLARGNPGMVEQARTMMERQLHQMIRLVDDLLDVSRVSRGKIELRMERIDLATALANAVETSKPLLDQNGQALELDLPSQPMPLNADLTRLAQVFANLLNNAAKYTDKGGHIRLSAATSGTTAVVRVRDDGIGIPPEMLERIFGIFTQVDRSLEKARGGLGIGLSIAKRLAEMHGGMIEALSDGPGRGSEFVVRLPLALGAAEPSNEKPNATAPDARMRRRVLIADDNIDSASSLSMMLQVMGNDVRVAHDGLEALSLAEGFRADAILLDIGMPGLNGYDVCRRIRALPWGRQVTIIALTGWGQEDDKRRSQDAGFDRHLVKPVEPATLARVLAETARR